MWLFSGQISLEIDRFCADQTRVFNVFLTEVIICSFKNNSLQKWNNVKAFNIMASAQFFATYSIPGSLHVSVTKFWHKFAILQQVNCNTPSSWDQFQNCCTDSVTINQGFWYFTRLRSREIQVNLRNPAKFTKTHKIPRNSPEILSNTCLYSNFETGLSYWGYYSLLAVKSQIYVKTSSLKTCKLPGCNLWFKQVPTLRLSSIYEIIIITGKTS